MLKLCGRNDKRNNRSRISKHEKRNDITDSTEESRFFRLFDIIYVAGMLDMGTKPRQLSWESVRLKI